VVGVVRVERAERAAPLPVHELGQIPAGGVREATVALDGLDPLDLIEGSVRLQLAIEAEGVVQDRVAAGIGETVSDPGNRDLVRVLLALARDAAADPHSIERAQRLMVRRIESDWRRAVQGRGNPYKDDWRDQGRRTAVGDLAASYAAERGDLVRPDVFVGLGSEIDRLAGDLPGMHPLLRKYLRRLAGRLG